jgi:hypothetical protein
MRPAFGPLRARLWENAMTVIDKEATDKLSPRLSGSTL